ncbi:hypothetical protein NC652_009904 [Populus alba x Populus x berolinensis]|nr:hypothetical protein NC652_009904 [Populus alba x Populus x berolinensis]
MAKLLMKPNYISHWKNTMVEMFWKEGTTPLLLPARALT